MILSVYKWNAKGRCLTGLALFAHELPFRRIRYSWLQYLLISEFCVWTATLCFKQNLEMFMLDTTSRKFQQYVWGKQCFDAICNQEPYWPWKKLTANTPQKILWVLKPMNQRAHSISPPFSHWFPCPPTPPSLGTRVSDPFCRWKVGWGSANPSHKTWGERRGIAVARALKNLRQLKKSLSCMFLCVLGERGGKAWKWSWETVFKCIKEGEIINTHKRN